MQDRRIDRYRQAQMARQPKKRHWRIKLVVFLVVVGAIACGGLAGWHHFNDKTTTTTSKSSTATSTSKTTTTQQTATTPPANACSGNASGKLILVSISKRHLWACDGTTVAYDSAVVTGMENLAADLTPVGTYHIYAKSTNLYLKGSDSTGSWNDYVNYWMPFLDNQYGAYGFHDATWRPADAFGNISPYSSNASHGCVECPLATAKWLYGWAPVGTTVTVES